VPPNLRLEVILELFVEVLLRAIATEQRPQPERQDAKPTLDRHAVIPRLPSEV
jgi:hypothetical protein